ncbi:MAG TPA: toxin-antitoxin system HicB family antitoxin [Rubrobacter sp.]|nr:toxin-antitoxin system HicB family antitoxin [Rubrobacter sp.]
MDSKAALTRFEAALTNQVALAGGDPAVESAARALRDTLRPAARQLALEFIELAAAEVDAQLPYHRVEVVIRGGEPAVEVRAGEEGERRPSGEEYEARITLRLPPSLKSAIEEAARAAGESVNSYVVRDLSRLTARPGRVGKRMKGTVRT